MNETQALAGAVVALGLSLGTPFFASASDHNEPAADAVWRADQALHKEWDISDLFAWHDRAGDRLNLIVAWHPQQLPRSADEQTQYSDQVLYTIHVRYERSGAQVVSSRFVDQEINFRYGRNAQGEWGMLVKGLPGLDPVVVDCDSEAGWLGHELRTDAGAIQVASGLFDDPFVFDLDGYNASLTRALDGEQGLRFNPENDTFEGHNATAFVLSIPIDALQEHWQDFDRDGNVFGHFATEDLHIWATTKITDAEAGREAEEG